MTSQNHDRHLSVELMQGFLDGEASPGEAERVRSHTASCARCRSELEAWQTLFADLGALEEVGPSRDFGERVLHALPGYPVGRPSLVRRLAAALVRPFRPSRSVGSAGATTRAHPASGVLQDFLEGLLPKTEALRIEGHLHACRDCRGDVEGWRHLLVRLDGLPSFAPTPDLTERVMAHVRVQLALRTAAPTFAERWQLVTSRITPRTRKRIAALAGAGVTPAVTLGFLAYVVFSHPLVTPRSLLSFLWLRGSDRVGTFGGGLLSRVTDSQIAASVYDALTLLLGSPASVALALAGVAGLTLSATWVLYRNVLASDHGGRSRVR